MDIDHPRRLLIVSEPGVNVIELVKALTGSTPALSGNGSVAGVTHEWSIKTNYYSANIPIWLDEIPDLEQWSSEFQKPEAKEVVQAIGAWVLCMNKSDLIEDGDGSVRKEKFHTFLKGIESVISTACGYGWEGVKIAVAMPKSTAKASPSKLCVEDIDDCCMEYGFEFVDLEAQGKNEFGENTGIERLKEALEANDWAGIADDGTEDDALEGFEVEESEMNAELWGLKASLLDTDDEQDEKIQVDDLEHLMSQALAIKEAGAELPLEERKKYAARAINSMMKEV